MNVAYIMTFLKAGMLAPIQQYHVDVETWDELRTCRTATGSTVLLDFIEPLDEDDVRLQELDLLRCVRVFSSILLEVT